MMALQSFMEGLAARLLAQVPTSMISVGPLEPYYVSEIPAVTISLSRLSHNSVGVGGNPRNLARGALALELVLDLANPVVVFPDETVTLLAADRLSVQVPHQPLVDVNGSRPEYLGANDLQVDLDGAGMEVVATPPGNNQCRLASADGMLEFASPLPSGGNLRVHYLLGAWEVATSKFTGIVTLRIYASGAADTERLSMEVATVLSWKPQDIISGLTKLIPLEWGPVVRAGRPAGQTKVRSLCYEFAFDHEQPIINTGGGPIRAIDVRSTMGPEQFLIT